MLRCCHTWRALLSEACARGPHATPSESIQNHSCQSSPPPTPSLHLFPQPTPHPPIHEPCPTHGPAQSASRVAPIPPPPRPHAPSRGARAGTEMGPTESALLQHAPGRVDHGSWSGTRSVDARHPPPPCPVPRRAMGVVEPTRSPGQVRGSEQGKGRAADTGVGHTRRRGRV